MDIIICVCVVVCAICIAFGKPITITIKHDYPEHKTTAVPQIPDEENTQNAIGMAECINSYLDGLLKDGDLNG